MKAASILTLLACAVGLSAQAPQRGGRRLSVLWDRMAKPQPARESTGSTPVFLSTGTGDVVLGGITAGQFPGSSNSNQAIELFVAKFGQ